MYSVCWKTREGNDQLVYSTMLCNESESGPTSNAS